jgi:hypothetical protein
MISSQMDFLPSKRVYVRVWFFTEGSSKIITNLFIRRQKSVGDFSCRFNRMQSPLIGVLVAEEEKKEDLEGC